MNQATTDIKQQVNALVDEYRKTCLWFLREDYYPETTEAAIRVLGYIEKHGDLAAFKKAATLRQWLEKNPCQERSILQEQ